MKDAYSFDTSDEGLHESYMAMYDGYVRIFDRVGLPVVICEASAGSMGGSETREFMLACEDGEDTIFACDKCDYTSNAECAESRRREPTRAPDQMGDPALVETPNAKTVGEVCEMLRVEPEQLVNDGLEMELFRGQTGKARGEIKAHLVAEDGQGPRAGAIHF